MSKSDRHLNGYVSIPEAAAMLGVSSYTLHRLLDQGRIPYTRPSVHKRVRRRDVLAYVEGTREGGAELAEVTEDLLA